LGLKYIYAWKYLKETTCGSYLYLKGAKISCFLFSLFSSTKAENRRVEHVLPRGEGWHQWKGAGVGERV
jgi:hypothetical protein